MFLCSDDFQQLRTAVLAACLGGTALCCAASTQEIEESNMIVKSSAFENGHPIPLEYSCDGKDISPPLSWEKIPPQTRSLALIVEDPDAPRGTFDHWLAWNIAADSGKLPAAVPLPFQGRNGFHVDSYRGPCPPRGKAHRYFFRLYALDVELDLPSGSDKDALLKAMEGHILGQAELMGRYRRI
jgi:hypothetical protein